MWLCQKLARPLREGASALESHLLQLLSADAEQAMAAFGIDMDQTF